MTNYDEQAQSKYLMYFDVNGLYGWTMMEALPISDFEWIDNISLNQILMTEDDAEYGYFLQVDIDYPIALHDIHNDYPMCSQKMSIGKSKEEKLILNLNAKKDYILHYRTLKLILKHGLELKRIHKILRFKQSKWLKTFIDVNTEKRLKCKNPFESILYKLMNNAIYGKSLENVKKHAEIKLVNKWEGRYQAKSLIARPNFKASKIFNENLAAIELNKMIIRC